MMTLPPLLALIFVAIIAFGVFMYVLLDGFDLGLGILFPFAPTNADRDTMMHSVAPVWDGNETWLVLGAAALFGAFPLAYGVLLSALYIPLLIMLIALVFRGIAFEFRFKSDKYRYLWDISFSAGSLIATFSQGVALGAFIQGFAVKGSAYAGGSFDWLTPFSLMTGVALISGYALLGATWLVMKTKGSLREWAYAMAYRQLAGVVFFMAAVSLATPFLESRIFERWFSWPQLAFLAPVPLAVALTSLLLLRSLRRRAELMPFLLSVFMFWLGYSGLTISVWPWLVPYAVTIGEAAAPDKTLVFMLWGFAIFIPLNLIYTAHAYWAFRGKTDAEGGYGH